MRTNRFLVCVLALALGMWGCDNEDETDAGPMGTDAGPMGVDAGPDGMDAGPTDGGGDTDAGTDAGGSDAGPPANFQVRIANSLPGLTGTTARPGGFHICLYLMNGGVLVPSAIDFVTQTLGPVPFRGVSPYTGKAAIPTLDYLAAFYEPANLGDPAACPADPNDAAAPTAAAIGTIPGSTLEVDHHYTVTVAGLLPDTLGGTGGALAPLCSAAPPATPTFGEVCTTAAQIIVTEDDQTAPAAGMTRFRVSNMIPNSTPPSGMTVCYDPGLVPNADGTCMDVTPTDDDHVTLAAAVPYGTVTEYMDRDAIVPTGVPVADAGGGIYITLEQGAGCPAFAASGTNRCFPMVTALPPMDPPLPDNIQPDLDPDTRNTIFITGVLDPTGSLSTEDASAWGASFFIWQDDYVAPAP